MTTEEFQRDLRNYPALLGRQELKNSTITKYTSDVARFASYIGSRPRIDRRLVLSYKAYLEEHYKPNSINSYLTGLNRFWHTFGCAGLCVKNERIQKRCSLNHVLSLTDYYGLLTYASSHKKWKYYCLMRTLACTGIRVGELRHITWEALEQRSAVILHKNKVREICFSDSLCVILRHYCHERGITSGLIFCGRDPFRPLLPSSIWKTLKRFACRAGVDPLRVYPHSFRHLFAKTYMREVGNLTELSDLLGHSSIETTRIYTLETMDEKRSSLARLPL